MLPECNVSDSAHQKHFEVPIIGLVVGLSAKRKKKKYNNKKKRNNFKQSSSRSGEIASQSSAAKKIHASWTDTPPSSFILFLAALA